MGAFVDSGDGRLRSSVRRVRDEWIDFNGHMNVGYYVIAFDEVSVEVLGNLGIDDAYREGRNASTFALEMHVTYERELVPNAPYFVVTQLLDADHKRLHLYHEMYHAEEGWLAATNELITMHMDMNQRRSASFPPDIQERVDILKSAHASLPWPERQGRQIAIRRK